MSMNMTLARKITKGFPEQVLTFRLRYEGYVGSELGKEGKGKEEFRVE